MLAPSVRVRRRLQGLVAVALFLLVVLAPAVGAEGEGVVHLYYFYDPDCPACAETHQTVLEPLLAEYGDRVIVEERNISEAANFDLLLGLEMRSQVMAGSIPEVFVGEDVLVGAVEIQGQLRERIDYYLAQGGVALPIDRPSTASSSIAAEEGTKSSAPMIPVAFFYQIGCDKCERSERDLDYLQEKLPQLLVRRFNVKVEPALNQYLCDRAHVPAGKHLTAPAVFVGDRFLVGDDVHARAIEALLEPYLASGAPEPWAGWESYEESAKTTIVKRFQSLGLLTVVGAGLLDGLNPCAFATMIFLVSYLTFRKREGKELLATGGAFSLGVFLTYLGLGFGFLKLLSSLPFLNAIGKWLYGATALLCLALSWGSLADYRKAKEGRLEEMTLKLPERLRGWSKTLIRKGTGAKRFVLSSFALGFGVSLVELACTGQVYLPTIIFVLGIPEWRTQASIALVIYNVMFILPLVGVFLLVYLGTSSQQLIDWMTRHAAAVKLGMAVLFLLLAMWLGYSIFAL